MSPLHCAINWEVFYLIFAVFYEYKTFNMKNTDDVNDDSYCVLDRDGRLSGSGIRIRPVFH